MPTAPDTWPALHRLLAALAAQYSADFRAAVLAEGLGREPVGVLLLAANLDPDPISAALMLACLPYFAETAFTTRLERLRVGGWLDRHPAGYTLSPRGRAAADAMHGAVRARLAALAPMPPADLERLAQLLERLFDHCRLSPRVPGQACVTLSGNAKPINEPGASPLARAARALEALNNFRCDAHRAAWQPLGVSGPAWETLTWLWQGRANSHLGLRAWAEKQPFPRGWAAADYAGFLGELQARGWVESVPDSTWSLTPPGRVAREAAEADTDARFYAPWAALTPAEMDELSSRAAVVAEALSAKPAINFPLDD